MASYGSQPGLNPHVPELQAFVRSEVSVSTAASLWTGSGSETSWGLNASIEETRGKVLQTCSLVGEKPCVFTVDPRAGRRVRVKGGRVRVSKQIPGSLRVGERQSYQLTQTRVESMSAGEIAGLATAAIGGVIASICGAYTVFVGVVASANEPVTIGLGISAGLGLAVSATGLIVYAASDPDTRSVYVLKPTRPSGVRILPAITKHGAGLSLTGRF